MELHTFSCVLRRLLYYRWVRSVKNCFFAESRVVRFRATRGMMTLVHTVNVAQKIRGDQAEKFIPLNVAT